MKRILFFHGIFAVAFVGLYSLFYQLPLGVLALHPLVVISVYTTVFFLTPRVFWVALATIVTFSLLCIYVSNLVAAIFWNEQISFHFFANNFEVISQEIGRFPIYLALIPIALLISFLVAYQHVLPKRINRLKDFGIFPFICLIMVIFYLVSYRMSDDQDMIWEGEPLHALFDGRANLYKQLDVLGPDVSQTSHNFLNINPNIIFFHADALRADRLGVYGNIRPTTPFIDSLVHQGAKKYQYGFSNCNESICGFSAILKSSFSIHDQNHGLIEMLSDNGYFTNFIGSGDLWHANLEGYFGPRVRNFLRADQNDSYYRHDDQFVLDSLDLFPDYQNIPTFFYLRMMSSHPLGKIQERYRKYRPLPGSLIELVTGAGNVEAVVNDHDNRAHQLDAYIEISLSTLRDKGYLDNAIVVIFGDHGDAMGEHGSFGHYNSLYNEEIKVPIIIWSSKNIELSLAENQFATLVDIPVTLLSHLSFDIPSSFLGGPLQVKSDEKLAYLDDRRGGRGFVYQMDDKIFKYIIDRDQVELLFDLAADPDEKTDLSVTRRDVIERIKSLDRLRVTR